MPKEFLTNLDKFLDLLTIPSLSKFLDLMIRRLECNWIFINPIYTVYHISNFPYQGPPAPLKVIIINYTYLQLSMPGAHRPLEGYYNRLHISPTFHDNGSWPRDSLHIYVYCTYNIISIIYIYMYCTYNIIS